MVGGLDSLDGHASLSKTSFTFHTNPTFRKEENLELKIFPGEILTRPKVRPGLIMSRLRE